MLRSSEDLGQNFYDTILFSQVISHVSTVLFTGQNAQRYALRLATSSRCIDGF